MVVYTRTEDRIEAPRVASSSPEPSGVKGQPRRPDKEHPRSPYVDTRRSDIRDTKGGETKKTVVRR